MTTSGQPHANPPEPGTSIGPLPCGHYDTVLSRPSRPAPHVLDGLTHLYVCCGLSTYRIADVVGIDRQRVNRWLTKAGVALRPRGRAAPMPSRDTGGAVVTRGSTCYR